MTGFARAFPGQRTFLPILGAVVAIASFGSKPGTTVAIVVGFLLIGCVLVAVHHAEVVAHRVGEPFGSLVLAVAVTVIEVALIALLAALHGEVDVDLAVQCGRV